MRCEGLLWVFLGGGFGAAARYVVSFWAQRLAGPAAVFPLGTLTVNVIGCLLLGFLAALATGPLLIRESLRLALLVGFLGGFTTFSTFAWETLSLARDGERLDALLNLCLSNMVGLLAVWLGLRCADAIYGN